MAPSTTTTSASCTSTSSTCRSCKPATAIGASATCSSPSTADPARCISRSRTTRPRRAPSPSCARQPQAFPFRLTHVLTDNGSCFTPAFARACAELGAEYRHTKPRTPQTNGMVERFNGRVGSEVLGITIYSHRALEQLLRGFNAAYNDRRQRVLERQDTQPGRGRAPRCPTSRSPAPQPNGRAGPCDLTKARLIADAPRRSRNQTRTGSR